MIRRTLPAPRSTTSPAGPAGPMPRTRPFGATRPGFTKAGISTPLVVRWPGSREAGIHHQRRSGHIIDLLPTCLEIAGVEYPSTWKDQTDRTGGGHEPGSDFSAAGKADARGALYWEWSGNRAVRQGDWKLAWDNTVRIGGNCTTWPPIERRSNDLANREPQRVEQMSQAWDCLGYAHRSRQDHDSPHPAQAVSQPALRQSRESEVTPAPISTSTIQRGRLRTSS